MIPLLLAELPSPESAQSIGWVAVTLAGICVGVNQVLKITDRFKASPPNHTQFASKADHAELKSRVDKISEDINGGFDRLDHKRSVSIAGLHDDLRDAVKDLRAEVKSDIGGVHNRLTELVAKISHLSGKIEK